MGAGHSAEGEGGAYASDPPARERRKTHNKRRRRNLLNKQNPSVETLLELDAVSTTNIKERYQSRLEASNYTDDINQQQENEEILEYKSVSPKKHYNDSERHSVDSVASYSSQNHVDRIRTQNFSAASCQDDCDFGSIKTSLFRRSSSNLEITHKRPESIVSTTSSTRSRLRELVERKSGLDEHKSAANTVGDIQYFENPTETLEFDRRRNSIESKNSLEENTKKRKLSKGKEKEKETNENKNKKHEKYQSKLAEYYKLPVQLPQDEFYKHLTRSKAAEELLQKRFSNSDTDFSSYGRLCKHKEPDGPNLRRSRSLAVIREETFTDLQIQNHGKSQRSQLIPRARLFDKPCFKDRLPGRAKYQTKEEVLESIYIDSTASCFGDISGQTEVETHHIDKSEREEVVSRNESHRSRSVSGSWPNLTEESKHTNLSEESVGHSRNPSEIDSLDSNYVRKHYNFDAHRKHYKSSSPETERSVVSPDHSKDFTTDDPDTDVEERQSRSKNTTPKSFTNDSLSITHSDKDKTEVNSVDLERADSYDEISIRSKQSEPREIQSKPNPENINDSKKGRDIQSVASENDGTVSSPPDSITSYISISIASSDKSQKLEHLANSLAEKIDEYCDSQYKETASIASHIVNSEINPDVDPIYTQINKKKTFADVRRDSLIKHENQLKTQSSDVYVSNTYIESDTYSTKSNATAKNITTEPFVTTLIENQYYSLPDINISKCLRKSERIDAQLREEDLEDTTCENNYEIAQSNFNDIIAQRASENYGQLNKTTVNKNNNLYTPKNTGIYLPNYSEPEIIQNFSKLEDDLRSIITIDSCKSDERDYYQVDTHQNEREINEIEGTIRNNKVITKSESLKLATNSIPYRPVIKISKSVSTDNINKSLQEKINQQILEKKGKTNIKKHYSLRQRDPEDDDLHRLPSPGTVQKSTLFNKQNEIKPFSKSISEDIKSRSLISRVQSFKTSPESSIDIVPLSGHQTIVIDPPLTQNLKETNKPGQIKQTNSCNTDITESIKLVEVKKVNIPNIVSENKQKEREGLNSSKVDTSSYFTPKDPFITIKLNKVVKTTIPKLKEIRFEEKTHFGPTKPEKPPSKLIIKDNNKTETHNNSKLNLNNMSRPQVLQVVDSKSKSNIQNNSNEDANNQNASDIVEAKQIMITNMNYESKEKSQEIKNEPIKEKLNNAIKTDIEYQEKLNSVKNYWSKLIDKTPENKEQNKVENKQDHEDVNNNTSKETNPTVTEDTQNDDKYIPEISVGKIVKSLESVKIVDSIRKISQTKLQLWKDETEKVKSDTEIEETTVQKIVKDADGNTYEKPPIKRPEADLSRDTPEIEIVELSSDDNENKKTQATLIKAKGFEKGCNEFDHVRYKVMKSELFKNSMIANYRKEAQFDGLLQYLQDYSFQELLVNNNIVIIEPVRTKVEPMPRKNNSDTCKIAPTLLKKNESNVSQIDKTKNAIRRHFFYHPIRVNKEIIEEELPNPDTVKKVRNLFEDTLKMKSPAIQDPPLIDDGLGLTRRATSYRNLNEEKGNKMGGRKKVMRQLVIDTNFVNKKWDNASLSSGVSSGDLSSNNEYDNDGLSPYSQKNLKDNMYSSSDEYLCDSMNQDFCCESQYVSPDILRKIRECGTSVTYYGGKVLNSSKTGSNVSPMTKAIMEEIKSLQKNCSRDCYSCQTKCKGEQCSCLVADKHRQLLTNKPKSIGAMQIENDDKQKRVEGFPNFKFKLVKSNSCSSRLELTGTDDTRNGRYKLRKSQTSFEDPPLLQDGENSVKEKICRLESYSKGIAKTPFENNSNEEKRPMKINSEITVVKKLEQTPIKSIKNETPKIDSKQDTENTDLSSSKSDKLSADQHTFEKKFYYLNEKLEPNKPTTGKFGEMVFEEFEVLESCFDSLNSNKSLK